ncbi:MAG: hypothetical protein JWQ72_1936 [Polaromonas sp.]|nr:hypothetical protein [Polaromonas sp.]
MMKSRHGLMVLAAGLMAGMGFASAPSSAFEGPGFSPATLKRIAQDATKPQPAQRSSMRALLGTGIGAGWSNGRRAKPGWTNRHVQRMAAKKRNRARHRARS